MKTGTCFKCNGSGKYYNYGVCFRCHGKGFVWLSDFIPKEKWVILNKNKT